MLFSREPSSRFTPVIRAAEDGKYSVQDVTAAVHGLIQCLMDAVTEAEMNPGQKVEIDLIQTVNISLN
jgi:hypothetical protein